MASSAEKLAELLFPKVVVLGATGLSGRCVVELALQRGYIVTAVARNPAQIDIKHTNLEVLRGNILEAESLEPIMEGKDAVLSCLGARGSNIFNPTKLYSDSMKAITNAMEKTNIKRIVCITSWCTEDGVPGAPKMLEWFLKPLTGAVANMLVMEKQLMSSDLNYTIVRPPGLMKVPGNGKYRAQADRQFLTGTSHKIPRGDLAEIMLKALETNEWDRKAVAVASEK